MVQHKDLMELPFQFWLGLLCYCHKTQSTSILPVLLSLAVVEDAHTTYPGVPIYIQEDVYQNHPSYPQPHLTSPVSALNGLIFITESTTIIWASTSDNDLDASICSKK